MKEMIFCMLLIPLSMLAQEEWPEPYSTVEVPQISLDVNGDGVAELTSGVMTVGTDDEPSSSGQHTWYLKTEPHCSMLYTEHQWSTQTRVASLPMSGEIPEVKPYQYYWSKEGMIELSFSGYGSASSGWKAIYPYGQEYNCIAVRFTDGELTYSGTIGWTLIEGRCEFESLKIDVQVERP